MAEKGLSFKVEGIPNLKRKLKKLDKDAENNVEDAIQEAALFVEGEVKMSISGQRAEPKSIDTGEFRRRMGVNKTGKFQRTLSSHVKYAPHLEYGTSRIKPRRHFRNSLTRSEGKIEKFIAEAIREAIARF